MNGRVLVATALVAVVGALATGNAVVVRTAYVLCALLLVSVVLSLLSLRGVDIVRQTRARRAQVGGLAEETFTVTNRAWLPKLWLEVIDRSNLPDHRASRVVSSLAPGHTHSWHVRTRCRRRGVFDLGPIVLASGDPLGMFRTRRELAGTVQLIVYPLTVPLSGLDLPTGYLTGGQVVRRRAQFATTNVRGVRGYQPADPFNRIHWPTTARRGQLYVKEFDLDPVADFWILVDLNREAHVGQAPESTAAPAALPWMEPPQAEIEPTTEEHAISAAASLASHFLAAGKSVGLIAHGQRRVVIQPDRGQRQVGKILSALAVLRARGRADVAQVLSAESHEFTRHTTLVVVTPTTALRWIEALRELRQRGVASLAVLVEASTFGPAASSVGAVSALAGYDIPARLIKNGDDLATALGG